ncbi:MAG: 30S ribosomal protein S27e [Candidatus Woesearchaeota archaeon]
MTKIEISQPKSKFIKVRCSKCKNEQIIFGTASRVVNCLVCSKELSMPSGGKSKLCARVLEVLD